MEREEPRKAHPRGGEPKLTPEWDANTSKSKLGKKQGKNLGRILEHLQASRVANSQEQFTDYKQHFLISVFEGFLQHLLSERRSAWTNVLLILGCEKMCEKSSTPQIDLAIMNNGTSLQHLNGSASPEDNTKVELGKKVRLLQGISIIVGTIIGAGIFISPKGILQNSGSIGMSLIVWISCGVLSLFGELFLRCWNNSSFHYFCTWRSFHWMLKRIWWRRAGQTRKMSLSDNWRKKIKGSLELKRLNWCSKSEIKTRSMNITNIIIIFFSGLALPCWYACIALSL